MLPRSGAGSRAPILVGWALGLACFVYLMQLPPTLNIADESFILSEAKRVYQGQALYRDFFDFLTPGAFYLYALAYAVGGVSITSARITTSLLHAISVVSTYFLTLQVASMGEAIVAGLLVVVVCVPVWNMASHHWIATAFGLATAAVLLARRWRGSERARPAAAGALAGLVVSTHQARGMWLIVWLAITIPLLTLAASDTTRWRRCLRELVWTAVGGAAVCVPIIGYAVWRSSLAEMLYATHTWVTTNYRNYNVGVVRWAGYGSLWAGGLPYTYLWLLQIVPKILAVEAISVSWAVWRFGLRSESVRLSLLLLAASAAAAIAYFPDIVHVAFVVPFAMIVLAGMVHRVWTALPRSDGLAMRVVGRLGFAVLLAIVLAKGWTNFELAWKDTPIPYESAFGRIWGRELQQQTVADVQRFLHVDPDKPPRIFAYPTDAWIYLTVPADNPTSFSLLRPVYNTPEQIQMAIDQLDRDPQAIVFLNTLFVKKGDPIMAYLDEHWHEVATAGPGVILGDPLYRLYARNPTS
jgi:hypothetical protein